MHAVICQTMYGLLAFNRYNIKYNLRAIFVTYMSRMLNIYDTYVASRMFNVF